MSPSRLSLLTASTSFNPRTNVTGNEAGVLRVGDGFVTVRVTVFVTVCVEPAAWPDAIATFVLGPLTSWMAGQAWAGAGFSGTSSARIVTTVFGR